MSVCVRVSRAEDDLTLHDYLAYCNMFLIKSPPPLLRPRPRFQITSSSAIPCTHYCHSHSSLYVRVPRAEDDLTLQDYLAYCHMSLQEDEDKVLTRAKAENASRRFAQVDTAGKGRITWCQFLNIETVRILKKRNKVSRSRRENKVSRSAFSKSGTR